MIIKRKLFAKKDYEGLTQEGKEALRKNRSLRAQRLNEFRNNINKTITQNPDSINALKTRNELHKKTSEQFRNLAREDRQNVINKFGKVVEKTTTQTTPPPLPTNIKKTADQVIKKSSRLGKVGKILGSGLLAAGTVGTGGYAYKKIKEKEQPV